MPLNAFPLVFIGGPSITRCIGGVWAYDGMVVPDASRARGLALFDVIAEKWFVVPTNVVSVCHSGIVGQSHAERT